MAKRRTTASLGKTTPAQKKPLLSIRRSISPKIVSAAKGLIAKQRFRDSEIAGKLGISAPSVRRIRLGMSLPAIPISISPEIVSAAKDLIAKQNLSDGKIALTLGISQVSVWRIRTGLDLPIASKSKSPALESFFRSLPDAEKCKTWHKLNAEKWQIKQAYESVRNTQEKSALLDKWRLVELQLETLFPLLPSGFKDAETKALAEKIAEAGANKQKSGRGRHNN